jgi:hypothetical protein
MKKRWRRSARHCVCLAVRSELRGRMDLASWNFIIVRFANLLTSF